MLIGPAKKIKLEFDEVSIKQEPGTSLDPRSSSIPKMATERRGGTPIIYKAANEVKIEGNNREINVSPQQPHNFTRSLQDMLKEDPKKYSNNAINKNNHYKRKFFYHNGSNRQNVKGNDYRKNYDNYNRGINQNFHQGRNWGQPYLHPYNTRFPMPQHASVNAWNQNVQSSTVLSNWNCGNRISHGLVNHNGPFLTQIKKTNFTNISNNKGDDWSRPSSRSSTMSQKSIMNNIVASSNKQTAPMVATPINTERKPTTSSTKGSPDSEMCDQSSKAAITSSKAQIAETHNPPESATTNIESNKSSSSGTTNIESHKSSASATTNTESHKSSASATTNTESHKASASATTHTESPKLCASATSVEVSNTQEDIDEKDGIEELVGGDEVLAIKAVCHECLKGTKMEGINTYKSSDVEVLYNSCDIQICSEEGSGISKNTVHSEDGQHKIVLIDISDEEDSTDGCSTLETDDILGVEEATIQDEESLLGRKNFNECPASGKMANINNCNENLDASNSGDEEADQGPIEIVRESVQKELEACEDEEVNEDILEIEEVGEEFDDIDESTPTTASTSSNKTANASRVEINIGDDCEDAEIDVDMELQEVGEELQDDEVQFVQELQEKGDAQEYSNECSRTSETNNEVVLSEGNTQETSNRTKSVPNSCVKKGIGYWRHSTPLEIQDVRSSTRRAKDRFGQSKLAFTPTRTRMNVQCIDEEDVEDLSEVDNETPGTHSRYARDCSERTLSTIRNSSEVLKTHSVEQTVDEKSNDDDDNDISVFAENESECSNSSLTTGISSQGQTLVNQNKINNSKRLRMCSTENYASSITEMARDIVVDDNIKLTIPEGATPLRRSRRIGPLPTFTDKNKLQCDSSEQNASSKQNTDVDLENLSGDACQQQKNSVVTAPKTVTRRSLRRSMAGLPVNTTVPDVQTVHVTTGRTPVLRRASRRSVVRNQSALATVECEDGETVVSLD